MTGFWVLGLHIYTLVIFVVNLNVLAISRNLSIFMLSVMGIFFVFYFVVISVMSSWLNFPFVADENVYYGIFYRFLTPGNILHIFLLTWAFTTMLEMALLRYRGKVFPLNLQDFTETRRI